jgi:aminopeptidase B
MPPRDPSSFSDPSLCLVSHVDLSFTIDPHARTLSGSGVFKVERRAGGVESLVLDTLGLEISSCSVPFALAAGEEDEVFGRALTVTIGASDSFSMSWVVTERSKATVWQTAEQTEGKRLPFFYTQGQSILNRGLFPCQDTPSAKLTFTASVTAPAEFKVAFSAPRDGSKADTATTTHFALPHPVPAYLIAFAVGDLEARRVGPRSVVYAEPCMVAAAQAEFDGVTERYLQAAEGMFGKYLWGEYNMLMVPKFPYGGMENVTLTFLSPTLVAGDGSLTGTVAHEIAHSWIGNLVTNSNWGEFYLNEGVNMYAERELVAAVSGRELSDLQAHGGAALLREEYKNLGEDNPITALRAKIDGIDPDDAYCQCAYEAGYLFFKRLERMVGGRDVFVAALRDYVAAFAWKSITSDDMLDFFCGRFPEHLAPHRRELERALDATGSAHVEWIDFSQNRLLVEAKRHAESWAGRGRGPEGGEGAPLLTEVHTVTVMLDELMDRVAGPSAVTAATVADLDLAYRAGLSGSKNAEIALRFCKLVVATKCSQHYPAVRHFLVDTSKGKQKFQLPIYRLFKAAAGDQGIDDLARSTFALTKDSLASAVKNLILRIYGEGL